jgi:hypothetical protein
VVRVPKSFRVYRCQEEPREESLPQIFLVPDYFRDIPARLVPLYVRNYRWAQRRPVEVFPIVVATVRVGRSLFTARNSYKTSPLQKRYSEGRKEHLHAEIALLSRFIGETLHGPLLVSRLGADGFRMAKPCPSCRRFLSDLFPSLEVIYTQQDGSLKWL